jgi:adenylate cyclase class 2
VKVPVETEIKIAVASARTPRAQLLRLGFAIRTARVRERNLVLDDARSSLRKKGLLLRVRRVGQLVICTWKGPEAAGRVKRRVEREFEASNYEECLALFAGLGYQPSFFYEKFRTEFERPREPGHVTLDETPIGTFLELEGPARWIEKTAKELGYGPDTWITRSYAGLYAQWHAEFGGDPTAMRFRKKAT